VPLQCHSPRPGPGSRPSQTSNSLVRGCSVTSARTPCATLSTMGCVAALVGAQVRSGHPMPTSMSRSQSGAHIERLWSSSWASHAVEIVVVDGMVLTVDGAHARNEKAAIPPRLGGSAIRSKAWTDGSNGTCCILYGHEDLLAWKTCGTDHVQKVKSAQLRAISRSQISLGKQNLTNGQNQAKISYIYQIGTSRISIDIKSWR